MLIISVASLLFKSLKILFEGENLIKTSSINPTCFGRYIEILNYQEF